MGFADFAGDPVVNEDAGTLIVGEPGYQPVLRNDRRSEKTRDLACSKWTIPNLYWADCALEKAGEIPGAEPQRRWAGYGHLGLIGVAVPELSVLVDRCHLLRGIDDAYHLDPFPSPNRVLGLKT